MNFHTIANFLSRHFTLILLGSFVVGVSFPGLARVPTHVITVLLALQVFFSCFNVEMGDVREIRLFSAIAFYLGRFILLPLAIFAFLDVLGCSYSYKVSIFLLILLPVGVSTPAFTSILNGNISLSLFLVILSSLLCPFVVPGLFDLVAGKHLAIDIAAMFTTLVLLILLPVIAHLPIRRNIGAVAWIKRNNPALVIPLAAGTFVLAIAHQREFLLRNWQVSMVALMVSLAVFLLLYVIIWLLSYREAWRNRLSYTLSSGLNNISLGIVLALLYLSSDVAVFLVVANISWVVALIPFRRWLSLHAPVV